MCQILWIPDHCHRWPPLFSILHPSPTSSRKKKISPSPPHLLQSIGSLERTMLLYVVRVPARDLVVLGGRGALCRRRRRGHVTSGDGRSLLGRGRRGWDVPLSWGRQRCLGGRWRRRCVTRSLGRGRALGWRRRRRNIALLDRRRLLGRRWWWWDVVPLACRRKRRLSRRRGSVALMNRRRRRGQRRVGWLGRVVSRHGESHGHEKSCCEGGNLHFGGLFLSL
ncbi:hypothetical protein M426DRAFT_145741 [Hypoxylon sp. CI-4A]|nr:hypothetical protein M426DRAFT_145741 [Hypoxylon sp. CI-4A]